MSTKQRTAVSDYQRLLPATRNAVGVEALATGRGGDCQSRLDRVEFLLGVYRMRYKHYVWQDHMPEAGEMERKIDRLLERWKIVRDHEASR